MSYFGNSYISPTFSRAFGSFNNYIANGYEWKEPMLSDYTPLKETELYFIYGTLKKGHRNHYILSDDKRYVGKYIIENYSLCEVAQGVPGLVENNYSAIRGELWEMGKNCVRIMEAIEQSYIKTNVTIRDEYTGKNIYASTWVWPKENLGKNTQYLATNIWDIEIENESYKNGITL